MATIEELRAKFTATAEGFTSTINSMRRNLAGIGDDTEKSVKKANKHFDDMQGNLKQLDKALEEAGDGEQFKDLQKSLKKAQDELEKTGEVSKESMDALQKGVKDAKGKLSELGDSGEKSFDGLVKAIAVVEKDIEGIGKTKGFNNLQKEADTTKQKLSEIGDGAQKTVSSLDGISKKGQQSLNELNSAASRAESNLGSIGSDGVESMRDVEKAATRVDSKLKDLGKDTGLDEASEDAEGFGDSLAKVGASTTVGGLGNVFVMLGKIRIKTLAVAAGAAGIITGFIKIGQQGDELQKALNNLESQTGATGDEMKVMEDSLVNIYKNNYGESFDDIAQAMATVKQATGETGDALEDMTKKALIMRDTFGFEVNESINTVQIMMKNFGITSDEAFNLLAQGQQKGLNKADDMLDTFGEYAPIFEQLGFDAEGMFNILADGMANGVRNTDVLADAVKEFGIRVKDGSKSTAAGFSSIGLDADKMSEKFAKGGDSAQAAFSETMAGLAKIKDPVERNAAGVALFGTKFEDLEYKAVLSLGKVDKVADKSANTLGKIDKVKYNSIGEALTGVGREITGNILIPLEQKVMPGINKFVGNAKSALSGGLKLMKGDMVGFQETITKAFGQEKGLAIIKFFLGIQKAVESLKPIYTTVFNGFKNVVVQILSYVSPYIKSIIGSITAWWKQNGSELLANVQTVFKGIFAVIKFIMPAVKYIIGEVFGAIKGVIMGALKVISGLFKVFAGLFTGDFKKMWQGVKDIFFGGIQLVWNALQLLFYGRIVKLLGSLVKLSLGLLKGLWKNGVGFFKSLGTQSANLVKNMANYILKRFKAAWDAVLKTFRFFRDTGLGIFKAYRATMQIIAEAIRKFLLKVFTALYLKAISIFTNLKNGVVKLFRFLYEGAIKIVKNLYNGIKRLFTDTWKTITGLVTRIKNGIVNGFTSARNSALNVLSKMKNSIKNGFNDMVSMAKALPGKIGSGIKAMGSKAVDGVKWLANRLMSGLGKGVNGVIGGVNWVLDKIGVDNKLKKWNVPQYATGTDGHPGGPMIVGDGGKPELVIKPSGETFLSPATDTLVSAPKGTQVLSGDQTEQLIASGVPAYKNGILSKIGGGLKKAGGFIKEKALDVWEYMSSPKKLLSKVLEKLGVSVPSIPGAFGDMANGAFKLIKDKAADFIKKKMDFGGFGGGAGPNIAGGAKAWRSMILRAAAAMRENISTSELMGIVAQIQRESGGNQKITQSSAVVDVNTLNGNPARGLLQYIPQTFRAYAVRGHQNIYNGYDQLLAFFNNKNWRRDLPYGRRGWGPTGGRKINGFYEGARVAAKQLAWIAERGPEYIIPTDGSQRAYELWLQAGKEIGALSSDTETTTKTTPAASGTSGKQTLVVQIPLNGRIVAEEIFEDITKFQNSKNKSFNRFGGVT